MLAPRGLSRSDRIETRDESHIPHGKEVPPGACWIIAPSQLLLHHWDAGTEGSSHPLLPTFGGRFLFDAPHTGLYTYEAQGYSHLRIRTLIAEAGRKLRAATRDDRWKKFIIHTDIHLHIRTLIAEAGRNSAANDDDRTK